MTNELLDIIFSPNSSLSDKFDAVKLLDDEETMSKVLLEANSAEIRSYALSEVNDQDTLIKVVTNDPNSTLRKFALDKLKSIHYEVFEQVVENDPDPLVRELAVTKMPQFYHEQFARILTEDPDSRVRHRASQRLRMDRLDQDQLRHLSINAVDPYIRRAATYSIENEQILQEIAILGDDIQIIQHCLDQITSLDSLKTIIQSSEFVSTKLEAIERVTDKDYLNHLLNVDTNYQVQLVCRRVLRDIEEKEKLYMDIE